MANPNGPKGKVFEPNLTEEDRRRMEREHREAVTRATNDAMARLPMSGRCGRALERLNVLCGKIGAPAVQIETLKREFAVMIIAEGLDGKRFDYAYKPYYNGRLSALLSAGAKARNEGTLRAHASGAQAAAYPRSVEITDAYEEFMQAFAADMRDFGIRRANDLPAFGGNSAQETYDLQNAAHKTLIADEARTAYEDCSRRGRASVAETCQAARRAVENAFVYANAFPSVDSQRVDINDPAAREKAIGAAVDVIRGLQDAHAARGTGWMFRHPFQYMREAFAIRSLKAALRERGGLTAREAEERLSAPKAVYADVQADGDEMRARYETTHAAEEQRRIAEQERERAVRQAQEDSRRRMQRDGLSPEAVHARGKAEVDADFEALAQIEEEERLRALQNEADASDEEREPLEIAEERPQEKSEPIAENGEISVPQPERK